MRTISLALALALLLAACGENILPLDRSTLAPSMSEATATPAAVPSPGLPGAPERATESEDVPVPTLPDPGPAPTPAEPVAPPPEPVFTLSPVPPTAVPPARVTPVPATPVPALQTGVVPYADESRGWDAPIVLATAGKLGVPGDDGSRVIGVGMKNVGNGAVSNVSSRLVVDGSEVYRLSVPSLLAGGTSFGYVALDEVVSRLSLSPGRYNFEFRIDSEDQANQPARANQRFSRVMVIARAPVPGRLPQSPVEATIRNMVESHTWVTNQNINEVMAIAREVLKDVSIDYSKIRVSVLPFDEFNLRYGGSLGNNRAERIRLTEMAANYPAVGLGFVVGSASSQEIFLREGLIGQLLSVLAREIGGAYYHQLNDRGRRRSTASQANELAVTIFEDYGVRVLQERFAWEGLNNVSYRVTRRPIVDALSDPGILGRYVRRLWSLAWEAGYDGAGYAPSWVLLDWYTNLIKLEDPTEYVGSLDRQAGSLDRDRIALNVAWRGLVDKEPSFLPEDVRRKIDFAGRLGASLTEDYLRVFQTHFVYP